MRFLILGLGAVLLSCAGMRSEAADTRIEIKTFAFAPQELTVMPGTTVTWINRDQTVHNVVGSGGKFASQGMDTDDRYAFKFEQEGDFAYLCALHPHMIGMVHVHSH